MQSLERAAIALAAIASSCSLQGCEASVVRAAPEVPIVADPGASTLVIVAPVARRYGPIWIGDVSGDPAGGPGSAPRILGALVSASHVVVRVPAGRHFIVAYDDGSYDAAVGDLAPSSIYALEIDYSSGELELLPLRPSEQSIKRRVDETTRVELAREPAPEEYDALQQRVELARHRWSTYAPHKRAARALRPDHAWR